VVRREDNVNGAIAKSRRQRAVPLDFLTVQAFDTYGFERMAVPAAVSGDFVFVNLFRGTVGAPMRLDAVNELVGAAARRAGIDPPPRPHQLRHAFASNVQRRGVASDATFRGKRGGALPGLQQPEAAQRARQRGRQSPADLRCQDPVASGYTARHPVRLHQMST
jgi:hypothetical protein